MDVNQFFSTAQERYAILLRRRLNHDPPWTNDPIFKEWRFCNVHREDDATTQWFRESVRVELTAENALEKTLIFRWFNRIEVGEKILDLLLEKWDDEEAYERLKDVKPIVTGAYMLKTPDGLAKLEGVLEAIDDALGMIPRITHSIALLNPKTLEEAWFLIKQIPWIGPFTGYEIVTDLRWTPLLSDAQDIMTWANPGPGCARGLSWLAGEKLSRNNRRDRERMLEMMRELLALSQKDKYWPQRWPVWEMREVEHWLCEFDKYKRAERGDSLKRRYP